MCGFYAIFYVVVRFFRHFYVAVRFLRYVSVIFITPFLQFRTSFYVFLRHVVQFCTQFNDVYIVLRRFYVVFTFLNAAFTFVLRLGFNFVENEIFHCLWRYAVLRLYAINAFSYILYMIYSVIFVVEINANGLKLLEKVRREF